MVQTIAFFMVGLSVILSYQWWTEPPSWRPDAPFIILSGVVVAAILYIAMKHQEFMFRPLDPVKDIHWELPRVRSYERVALAFMIVATATVVLGILRDPNLTVYGLLVVLLAVGGFIGLAVPKRKDAFVSGFVAGLSGIWLGCLVFVPFAFLFTQPPSLLGFFLALGVGFSLGFVLGLVAGVFCGLGGLVGSTISRRKAANRQ